MLLHKQPRGLVTSQLSANCLRTNGNDWQRTFHAKLPRGGRFPQVSKLLLGFSMLELVFILAIIGIIAVAALVTYMDDSIVLDSLTQQLSRDLRYTQAISMSRGQRYRLDLAANSYTLRTQAGVATNFPAGNASTVSLGTGYSLGWVNLPNNYVIFDGYGVPYINTTTTLSATATLTLTSPDGNTRTITISPETGRIFP